MTDRIQGIDRTEASLADRVKMLQAENGYLRRMNRVRPHIRIVLKAVGAANELAAWHCAGWLTSREACLENGMSNDTWYAGRALLILANLYDDRRWLTDDIHEIDRKLREAAEYAKRRPQALLDHIPPSKRPNAGLD